MSTDRRTFLKLSAAAGGALALSGSGATPLVAATSRATTSRERDTGKASAPLNILIQVNVSAEKSKSGVALHEARNLASVIAAMPRLRLRGLMAIPEPGAPRSRYQEVKKAFDSLKDDFAFDTLSMGMSDDLDIALEEGATMVRIGTSIFGPRLKQQSAA